MRFNPSHPVFAGHFPGHPIVPGACLVQIAEDLTARLTAHPVRFTAIRNLNKILIEEFLGKDVLTLWKLGPFKDDPFGQKNKYIKDICLFAIQGLERLKYIHDKNIIHRDIKTDNFLIGRKDPDIIYLIDFGLAKKYRSSRTGKHIKYSKTGNLIGSMNYASCNSMKGYEISRRDDLESFGYLLLNLAKGGLAPWIKYCEMKI